MRSRFRLSPAVSDRFDAVRLWISLKVLGNVGQLAERDV
jgi:hypothetical protein